MKGVARLLLPLSRLTDKENNGRGVVQGRRVLLREDVHQPARPGEVLLAGTLGRQKGVIVRARGSPGMLNRARRRFFARACALLLRLLFYVSFYRYFCMFLLLSLLVNRFQTANNYTLVMNTDKNTLLVGILIVRSIFKRAKTPLIDNKSYSSMRNCHRPYISGRICIAVLADA